MSKNILKSGSTVELREISKNKQNHCAVVGQLIGFIKMRSEFIKTYKDVINMEEELLYLKHHCYMLKYTLESSYLIRR